MKKLKRKLKNRLLRYLLNAVTEDQVYTFNTRGNHFIGGERLSSEELLDLGRQVRDHRNTRLYKILSSTLKNKAHSTIFDKSLSFDDVMSGKMLLLALDTQDKVMDKLEIYYKTHIGDK